MPTFPVPVTPAEALRKSGTTIDVAEGSSVAIGYFSSSFSEVFRIAHVKGFEDLQTLGLIPADLSEQETLGAIADDDANFLEQDPRARLAHRTACADCDSGTGYTKRRWYQSNLARVLSKSYKRNVALDGLEVLTAHRHISRVLDPNGVSRGWLVGIANPDDINIGAGATLFMGPTVHVLRANVITIDSEGALRFESGNVNVTCNELNGPDDAPVIIPDLRIPKYVIPGEDTIGGLLARVPHAATLDSNILTAHKLLPGFDAEYQLAHAANGF